MKSPDLRVLPPIVATESLGRSVFSGNQARRADRGGIDPHVFLEREGVDILSVDRMDHTTPEEMAEIGDRVALGRGIGRSFYGWAIVAVEKAAQDGRTVVATPRLDNRYHADIELNIGARDEHRDIQIQHATSLAAVAHWSRRPPTAGDSAPAA